MSNPKSTKDVRVDQFFTGAEARFDRWRSLLQEARSWEGLAGQQKPEKEGGQATVSASLQELRNWEDFFAYPGHALLKALSERIEAGDAKGTVRLAQTISAALLTHSYRNNLSDWEGEDQSPIGLSERLPGGSGETAPHRPYFEVLVVSPARPAAW
jgi:arginine decarboxylase